MPSYSPSQIALKPLMVSSRSTSLPGEPVKHLVHVERPATLSVEAIRAKRSTVSPIFFRQLVHAQNGDDVLQTTKHQNLVHLTGGVVVRRRQRSADRAVTAGESSGSTAG